MTSITDQAPVAGFDESCCAAPLVRLTTHWHPAARVHPDVRESPRQRDRQVDPLLDPASRSVEPGTSGQHVYAEMRKKMPEISREAGETRS